MNPAPAMCQYCHHPACFQAQLAATGAGPGQSPLCTLSACGRHLAELADDLPQAAHDHGLAYGHVTLLATDPTSSRTTPTAGRLPSSVEFSRFTVPAA